MRALVLELRAQHALPTDAPQAALEIIRRCGERALARGELDVPVTLDYAGRAARLAVRGLPQASARPFLACVAAWGTKAVAGGPVEGRVRLTLE